MELAPPAVRQRAEQATGACTNAGKGFPARKKNTNVAAVVVARELAGWCRSLSVMCN
ncbi:hypothetical protein [Streptomyces himalayensis]|uniref:hypothetical protein n=1 Tax=Streptomyces himalayensis TaxID=2820085 RepID=UPI001C6A46AC|nr:hypothetical protein [Streptomyces himalayensis]